MHLLRRNDLAKAVSADNSGRPTSANSSSRLGPGCLHKNDFPVPPQPSARPLAKVLAAPLARPRSRSRPLSQAAASSCPDSSGTTLSSVSQVAPHVDLRGLALDENLPSEILVPQLGHRVRLAEIVEACLQPAWAPATRRAYTSALQSNVSRLEANVGAQLLPFDSDIKLMVVFAGLDGRPWSTIQAQRAALRAWHLERSLLHLFEAAWTDQALHFWRGLKKRADHSHPRAKQPIDQHTLILFQRCRFGSGKLAGMRDAAAGAFCFYGVRRSSEMIQHLRSDVRILPDCIECFVRKQKNDPFGFGMRCWIPCLPELGLCCPYQLIQNWCAHWDVTWAAHSDGHLFCVTHLAEPKALSSDSWRRAILNVLPGPHVGTHSLRKGGARWWKFTCQLPDDLVQAQGGWSTPECMRAFYAKFSETERRDLVIAAASHAQRGTSSVSVSMPCASATSRSSICLSPTFPIWRRPS